MPERDALNAIVTGAIERDSYSIQKVKFVSVRGHYVTGNLYRPKDGSSARSAVLVPHGHFGEGRFYRASDAVIARDLASGAERTRIGAEYPFQALCVTLARLGCVVFHYDMVGYGESRQIAHSGDAFRDAEAVLRLQSIMGLQTWNSIRALDFLASLPDVDPARIGVAGASGGATQAFVLCAVDDRPAAAFHAVMVSAGMQGGDVCENAPLLRIGTNNVELAALFAPKPMALTGANDWTRDIMSRGLPELQVIYGLFDAEEYLDAAHYPFAHGFNLPSRQFMYAWFNTHLKLGHTAPIAEEPFVPASREELSVYDAADAAPADAFDARALRESLTRTSRERLTAVARDQSAYRTTVRAALHAMINDPLVAPSDVLTRGGVTCRRQTHAAHQAVLTRRGSGEVVPVLELRPLASADAIVIWTHPDGARSMFEDDGVTPVRAVQWLLAKNAVVAAPDVFGTGEWLSSSIPNRKRAVPRHGYVAGFDYGYNRTVLANRVRDLLTVVAYVQEVPQRGVHIVAFGRAGIWALLARALAGSTIRRASLDLGAFDFTTVRDVDDDMMLPGALNFGGVWGLFPVCDAGATEVYRAPRSSAPWIRALADVAFRDRQPRAPQMVQWLLEV